MDIKLKRDLQSLEISSVILKGDNSVGEFYSVALSNNCQQADTGTKMSTWKNTSSRIVSKGISAGRDNKLTEG